jgi:hypothetical protein
MENWNDDYVLSYYNFSSLYKHKIQFNIIFYLNYFYLLLIIFSYNYINDLYFAGLLEMEFHTCVL